MRISAVHKSTEIWEESGAMQHASDSYGTWRIVSLWYDGILVILSRFLLLCFFFFYCSVVCVLMLSVLQRTGKWPQLVESLF